MSALNAYPKRDEKLEDGKPRNWGFFGYDSALVHMIVMRDDDAAMREVLALGLIKKDSEVLGKPSMAAYCQKHGAAKCEAPFA